MMEVERLIEEANNVRRNAHVPYSNFRVGAALQTRSGKVYTGCNIENAAFSVTCCAERVAIFKAVSENEVDFTQLAVIADTDAPVSPCGACRQVMSEFFDSDVEIHLASVDGLAKTYTIDQLLPFSFNSGDVKGEDKN